jgi:hypothetical protein
MAKSPPLPAILIANDLLSGDVIFLGENGWVSTHRKAKVANRADEAETLLAKGTSELKANRVVDPYLVEVGIDAVGVPEPLHYREKMRTLGPTVRPDLGKQAEH